MPNLDKKIEKNILINILHLRYLKWHLNFQSEKIFVPDENGERIRLNSYSFMCSFFLFIFHFF